MPHHIFFTWQSDTGNRVRRGFVQSALERAIRAVNADADIDPADRELQADRDTLNVPGMPPLADTIFDKIDLRPPLRSHPRRHSRKRQAPQIRRTLILEVESVRGRTA